MPYISAKDDRRKKLRNGELALIAGELNYQIFYYIKHNPIKDNFPYCQNLKILDFVKQFLGKKPNYQKYNDMTGCLIRCYKEVKRRLGKNAYNLLEIMDSYDKEIAKYEDLKCSQNGDVE